MTENCEDTADSNNMKYYNYKKRLIYQHDPPPSSRGTVPSNGVKRIKLGSSGGEKKSDASSANNSGSEDDEEISSRRTKKSKKVKRKRKNCRSQFRHESMELIKLGSNTSSPHFKTKNILSARTRKPMQDCESLSSQNENKQKKILEILEDSIRQVNSRNHNQKVPSPHETDYVKTDEEINSESMKLSWNSKTGNGHHLPQMVPDRKINVTRRNGQNENLKGSKISEICCNLQAQKLGELNNSMHEIRRPKLNDNLEKEQVKTSLSHGRPNKGTNTGRVSPIRISIRLKEGMFGSILSPKTISSPASSVAETSRPTTPETAPEDEGFTDLESLVAVPCPKKQDALSKVFRCAPAMTTAVASALTSAVISVVASALPSPVTPALTSAVTPLASSALPLAETTTSTSAVTSVVSSSLPPVVTPTLTSAVTSVVSSSLPPAVTPTLTSAVTSAVPSALLPTVTPTLTSAVTSVACSALPPTVTPALTSAVTSVMSSALPPALTPTLTSAVTSVVSSALPPAVTPTLTSAVTSVVTSALPPTVTPALTSAVTSVMSSALPPALTPTLTSAVTSVVSSALPPAVTPTLTSAVISVVSSALPQTVTRTSSSAVTSVVSSALPTAVTPTLTPAVTSVVSSFLSAAVTPTSTSAVTSVVCSALSPTVTRTLSSAVTSVVSSALPPAVTPTSTPAVTSVVSSFLPAAVTLTSTSAVTSVVSSALSPTVTPTSTSALTPLMSLALTPTVTSPVNPKVTRLDTPAMNLTVNSAVTVIVNAVMTPTDTCFSIVDLRRDGGNDQTEKQTIEDVPKTVKILFEDGKSGFDKPLPKNPEAHTEPKSKTKIGENCRPVSRTFHRRFIKNETEPIIVDLTDCPSPPSSDVEADPIENTSETHVVENQKIQIEHQIPESPKELSTLPEKVSNDSNQNGNYSMTEMAMLYDRLINKNPVENIPCVGLTSEENTPSVLRIGLPQNCKISIVQEQPQNSHLSEPAISSHNDLAHLIEKVPERSPNQCKTNVSQRIEIHRQKSVDESFKIKSSRPFLIRDIISDGPTNTDTLPQEPAIHFIHNPVDVEVQQDSSPNVVSRAIQETQPVSPPQEVEQIVGSPVGHSGTLQEPPQHRFTAPPQETQIPKSPIQSTSNGTINIISQEISNPFREPENISKTHHELYPFRIPRTTPETQLLRNPAHQLTSNATMNSFNVRSQEKSPLPSRSPENIHRAHQASSPTATSLGVSDEIQHMDGSPNSSGVHKSHQDYLFMQKFGEISNPSATIISPSSLPPLCSQHETVKPSGESVTSNLEDGAIPGNVQGPAPEHPKPQQRRGPKPKSQRVKNKNVKKNTATVKQNIQVGTNSKAARHPPAQTSQLPPQNDTSDLRTELPPCQKFPGLSQDCHICLEHEMYRRSQEFPTGPIQHQQTSISESLLKNYPKPSEKSKFLYPCSSTALVETPVILSSNGGGHTMALSGGAPGNPEKKTNKRNSCRDITVPNVQTVGVQEIDKNSMERPDLKNGSQNRILPSHGVISQVTSTITSYDQIQCSMRHPVDNQILQGRVLYKSPPPYGATFSLPAKSGPTNQHSDVSLAAGRIWESAENANILRKNIDPTPHEVSLVPRGAPENLEHTKVPSGSKNYTSGGSAVVHTNIGQRHGPANTQHLPGANMETKTITPPNTENRCNNNLRKETPPDIEVRSSHASAIVNHNQSTSSLPRDLPLARLGLVPQGKLFYIKRNNVFVRYFDDTQKKLFFNNFIETDGSCRSSSQDQRLEDDRSEVIVMPNFVQFSSNDQLSVEEYVVEMTCVEQFMPRDFFAFYKFVTGYQICNDNLPVSFLTFLNVYNTNGLKNLLDRYVESLKRDS